MDAQSITEQHIELRLLRYVIAVAEELHFGRAAKRLHLSAPALSRQIKDLETAVGYMLFERQTREVALTLMLIVDQRLRILYSERLGRESARLDRVFLYQDRSKPTFVLTRDYSIGWGSYNGPISYFLEVSGNGIRYILPHGLITSLKTTWAIVPTNTASEILSKKCRPDFDKSDSGSLEFKVIYERFAFQDGSWHTTLREQSGFWESGTSLDPKEFSV